MRGMKPAARTIASLEDLRTEAEAFAGSLSPQEGRATLVTLSGALGAGKTAFVQAAAKALGLEDQVTSPTFVLSKSYALPEGRAFRRLVHMDAYRLKGAEELPPTGFHEDMKDAGALIMLEWPEMVEGALPQADVKVRLDARPDQSREISYA